MPNQVQNPNDVKYDLEDRTAKFGEECILFAKTLPENLVNRPLVSQFIRSATSVGANYMEADGAGSRKDFFHKISIVKKESKESMHWLRMLARANPEQTTKCRELWKEAHELTLIFSSILQKR